MRDMTLEIYTPNDQGIMTQTQYIIMLDCIYIMSLMFALTGLVSNLVNIRVFVVMGFNDVVTISFLALAIFDVAYLISSLSFSISVAFHVCELKLKTTFLIDPFAIILFSANVMNLMSITNVLTTTFLAVVRCLCVAKPLQFKNTITKKRTILFMAGIAIFSVIIYMPILPYMGIRNKFDMYNNKSRPSLWVSPERNSVKNIVWMLTEMCLPFVTQFVILVCIVIMIHSLRAASKFRQTSGAAILLNNMHDCSHGRKTFVCDSGSNKLTGKDLRVVQQVVLISLVYIVCNAPKMLITSFTTSEPEFTISKKYSYIYIAVNCLKKDFEIVNAAVNLIVYYKYNTKFRSVLSKLDCVMMISAA